MRNSFKKAIRERMAQTGENYTTARRFLLEERAAQSESVPEEPKPKVA